MASSFEEGQHTTHAIQWMQCNREGHECNRDRPHRIRNE